MPPSRTPLDERLRGLRERAGLTQEEAARAAGVAYNTLRNWERGTTPTATQLTAIARAYACTVDEILGCAPTPGRVLVDQCLADALLSLTKEDGEAGLQAIVDKHGPGTPFNWLAVVPDGAVWMTRADAADLRARVLSHVESVAPKLYRKWILARSSYTSRPK